MTVAVFAVVIVALVVERTWREREHARERRRLTNAIVAKNGTELAVLDRDPRPRKPATADREMAEQLDNPVGW